jgi:dienelactone hydrolase
VKQERIFIGEVPVLVSRPAPSGGPAPLVLLSHGFTGCKENFSEQLRELSGKGYLAAAMDNRLHGERAGAGFASLLHEGRLDLVGLRRVMQETASDMRSVIDDFVGEETVDPDRIAVAGVSMGGFVTFAALVDDARIKVATPIIASPYWSDIPGDTAVDLDVVGRAGLAAFSKESEPAARMESIPPRPLLIQIGAEDNHYDGGRVERFCEQLLPLYGDDSERLHLIVHPGVGHELTPGMWANAVAWLDAHL